MNPHSQTYPNIKGETKCFEPTVEDMLKDYAMTDGGLTEDEAERYVEEMTE